jgi:hypothetical protein
MDVILFMHFHQILLQLLVGGDKLHSTSTTEEAFRNVTPRVASWQGGETSTK